METRTCSRCGGRVDVMPVPDLVDDSNGEITPRIAACERCGASFAEAALRQLPRADAPTPEHKLHY